MKNFLFFSFVSLWIIICENNAKAQKSSPSSPAPVDLSVATLDSLEISVSRIRVRLNQMPQKVNIISRSQIENTVGDMGDILKRQSSVNVMQYPQVLSFISIRGFQPRGSGASLNPETSVYLNGRQAGTFNMALIDPNAIERVELLKGASAAMYGSSVMGGLVNVRLRHSTGKIHGRAYVGYGSFNTMEFGMHVGGSISKKLDFDLSTTLYNRDDFRYGGKGVFRKLLGGETRRYYDDEDINKLHSTAKDDNQDNVRRANTGIGTYSAYARLGWQISKKWRVDVTAQSFTAKNMNYQGNWRFGDSRPGMADRLYNTGDITLNGTMGHHQLMFRAYISQERSNTYNLYNTTTLLFSPKFLATQADMNYYGMQLQDEVSIGRFVKLVYGVDYMRGQVNTKRFQQGSAAQNYPITNRAPSNPNSAIGSAAAFAQAHISLLKKRLIINPSIRVDYLQYDILKTFGYSEHIENRQGNAIVNPALSAQYTFDLGRNHNLVLHSNAGRAFRYADAIQVAGLTETPTVGGTSLSVRAGNPNLKNETNITWDAGVRVESPKHGYRVDVTYFDTRVFNRIALVNVTERIGETGYISILNGDRPYTISSYQTYENTNYARIQGLEVDLMYDFGALNNFRRSYKVFLMATQFFTADNFTKSVTAGVSDKKTPILNVANTVATFGFEFNDHKHFSARVMGRYVGHRWDHDLNVGNPNLALYGSQYYMQLARYMIFDFTGTYSYNDSHSLSLRLSNLTNENYYEKSGYNYPGRFISVRYSYRF